MSNTNIRNGAQSSAYHAARHEACTSSIMRGDWDALDAYDGTGCFMPEGGLSDAVLSAMEFDDMLNSIKA